MQNIFTYLKTVFKDYYKSFKISLSEGWLFSTNHKYIVFLLSVISSVMLFSCLIIIPLVMPIAYREVIWWYIRCVVAVPLLLVQSQTILSSSGCRETPSLTKELMYKYHSRVNPLLRLRSYGLVQLTFPSPRSSS